MTGANTLDKQNKRSSIDVNTVKMIEANMTSAERIESSALGAKKSRLAQ